MTVGVCAPIPEVRLVSRDLGSIAEITLFHAYAGPLRTETCRCGGQISAPGNDWAAIAAAVAVHNESTAHAWWAIDQGLRPRGERPTIQRTAEIPARPSPSGLRESAQLDTSAAAPAGGAGRSR